MNNERPVIEIEADTKRVTYSIRVNQKLVSEVHTTFTAKVQAQLIYDAFLVLGIEAIRKGW